MSIEVSKLRNELDLTAQDFLITSVIELDAIFGISTMGKYNLHT